MTPNEFDQAVRKAWDSPSGSLGVLGLVQALSNDAFRNVYRSPPPPDQPEELARYLAWCFRIEAVRRAETPIPSYWDRLMV